LQGKRVRSVETGLECLVHNGTRGGCLFADGMDGSLKDVALTPGHPAA
jgi:hypothetical protein